MSHADHLRRPGPSSDQRNHSGHDQRRGTPICHGRVDVLEKNALDRDRIDWQTLRRDTLDKASSAQSLSDTYEAIRFAVRSLVRLCQIRN